MVIHWSISEVEAAVEDYFNMLCLELTEQKYNKAAHRRALTRRLNNRSNGSIELKHQNISAVLIDMGIPYIAGYKPRFNYQKTLLPEAISEFLQRNPHIQQLLKTDSESVPKIPSVQNILAVMEAAPKRDKDQASVVAETSSFR